MMKTEKKEEWSLIGSWEEIMNFIAGIPKDSISRVEIWKPISLSEDDEGMNYFCLIKCEKKI